MKLINVSTGDVIVEYIEKKVIFNSTQLESIMKIEGITIPVFLLSNFNNRSTIKLGEEDFQRAFKEVYYEFVFDHTKFIWKK